MKRLLSGIKPTGDIHIGNYFGAMKQFVDLQKDYDSFIFIADLHALNQIHDAQLLSKLVFEIAKAYLAIGLDPEKVVLFRQSDIMPVTELCWIFNSITSMASLKRAHAYKDAIAKNIPINIGLFDYPVLMAADILLYNTDVVPVGKDQVQHVEIAREIAGNFNNVYGETFKLPESKITEDLAVIKGLDGRKMSKSYKNVIGLFDAEDALKKKIMSIKTDSKSKDEPKVIENSTLLDLHKLFSITNYEQIRNEFVHGGISYKESKEILYEDILKYFAPIREKKKELDNNPEYVLKILKDGKEKALIEANKKIEEVKDRI